VSGLCNTDVDKNIVEISIQRMINSYICLSLEANLGSGITANSMSIYFAARLS